MFLLSESLLALVRTAFGLIPLEKDCASLHIHLVCPLLNCFISVEVSLVGYVPLCQDAALVCLLCLIAAQVLLGKVAFKLVELLDLHPHRHLATRPVFLLGLL